MRVRRVESVYKGRISPEKTGKNRRWRGGTKRDSGVSKGSIVTVSNLILVYINKKDDLTSLVHI